MVRGKHWFSKNATFSIRNYLNGALLYYEHICQKGSDNVVEGELYSGTSMSAEGYAAHITFQKAKKEGMEVANHWQDADSSSAKAVREVYPSAQIMICGGHVGRAHRKMLEIRQKAKTLTPGQIESTRMLFLMSVIKIIKIVNVVTGTEVVLGVLLALS